MMLQIQSVLSPEQVSLAQSLLREASWEDGRDTAGPNARSVKNNQQLGQDTEAARTIRQMVLAGLDRSAAFFSATLPLRVYTPRVNRYTGTANAFGNHVDGAIRVLPSGDRVRADISCTVFLNNPEDYDGGELVVSDHFGDQRVKLPAGHAVLYPSGSLHQVKPVTRGERLACFFWVQSMIRADEQRRLLYDLDLAISSIREKQGETHEATALTGVYHNLIRMWSET
ncbi:MAG: Fe2+-dependent dioxygenase [Burkholderiaceae bacterium]